MKRISWKKRLVLSYIFIGVIPLLVLGAFFWCGNRVAINRETEKSNVAMLQQAMQKLDYVEEKMNSAAYHFSGTEMAGKLKDMRNKAVYVDDGMLLSQLLTYSDIVSDEKNPVQMLLYLRGDAYIYTRDGRIAYSEFEDQMKQYGDLNAVSFFTGINSVNSEKTLYVNGKSNAILWFLYPIPYMDNIPVATIGFGLDQKAMESLIKTYYPLDSNVFLLNDRMQTIFSGWSESLGDEEKRQIEEKLSVWRKDGERIQQAKIGGKSYIVLREISSNSGFTLVSVAEKDKFYSVKNNFGIWFGSLLFISLTGGIILAVLISRNTYKPVQKLLDHVLEGDESEEPGENELEKIHSRWDEVQSKNEELSALVNRQRPMVVASCLRRILKGKFQSREEMEATLKSAAINLSYQYHFVILVPIPSEEGFDPEKNLRVLSIIEKIPWPNIHLYGLDMLKDDGIAIIVNCREKEMGVEGREIRAAVSEWLWENLKKVCGMEQAVYVGRVYEDQMEISRSFIEAMALANDYRMAGNRKYLLFEEIGQEETQTQYPILEQAVYIQCLKQANDEAALRALDNMVHEIEPLKSLVITQCLCFDIINAAIRTVDSMKGFALQEVDMKKVCMFSSLSEFEEKASWFTSEICRQYAMFKETSSNKMKSGILNYVNTHFGDSNMGLETVADEFGISANYLSRFFKAETGCTFIQYVTMIRMDKARELLVDTDMPIKEIVFQIGYIDSANFVRKFKGYEGITPGQYREKMKKQQGK